MFFQSSLEMSTCAQNRVVTILLPAHVVLSIETSSLTALAILAMRSIFQNWDRGSGRLTQNDTMLKFSVSARNSLCHHFKIRAFLPNKHGPSSRTLFRSSSLVKLNIMRSFGRAMVSTCPLVFHFSFIHRRVSSRLGLSSMNLLISEFLLFCISRSSSSLGAVIRALSWTILGSMINLILSLILSLFLVRILNQERSYVSSFDLLSHSCDSLVT